MKHKILLGAIVSVFMVIGVIGAQEQETKINLPKLTPEQKINRLAWFQTNSTIVGITFAKSIGKTAEDYGKHMVEIFAPGWSSSKGSPIRMIQGMYRNLSLDPNFKMEIISSSDTEVTGKMTVNGIGNFSGGMYFGVSLKEFMRCWEVWQEGLADYLGLVWKQDFDGELINFTLTVKK